MSAIRWRSIFVSKSGLRWGWNILSYLLIVTATVVAVVGPILLVLAQLGLSPQIAKPITNWSSIISPMLVLIPGYFAFLLGTHIAQRVLRHNRLGALGLQLNKRSIFDAIIGIGLGALIVGVSVILSWLAGWYKPLGFAWQFRSATVLGPAIIMALIAKIQPALLEEVIFRGYVFQTLGDRWGLRAAALISSLLFGLAHLSALDNGFPWWAAVLSTFLAGLMFAQAYLVFRSLWLPMGIHFGWVMVGRFLNDVGGPVEKALFLASEISGPQLIVNPAGGGAGLLELVGVGLVSLILWKMSRSHRR